MFITSSSYQEWIGFAITPTRLCLTVSLVLFPNKSTTPCVGGRSAQYKTKPPPYPSPPFRASLHPKNLSRALSPRLAAPLRRRRRDRGLVERAPPPLSPPDGSSRLHPAPRALSRGDRAELRV
uniref:Uncharacterized protein n=1 Tax=Oryza glumipatula TaxID=40148 RepID=A0A0D9YT00_9ORYZ